jgi:hypothetical protein
MIRSWLRDHEPCPDLGGPPAPLGRNVADQATTTIGGRKDLADVNELRLQLDNQHRPHARVPAYEVDDPALAVAVEGDLRQDGPTLINEHWSHLLAHRGVTTSHESIEISASPPRDEIDPNLEGRRSSSKARQADDVTALDGGVGRGRHATPRCDISLSLIEAQANPTQRKSDGAVVHLADCGVLRLVRDHLGLISRSTNVPKPRVPTNTPSRMTGVPRTKTERTAPVTSRPS